MKWKFLSTHYPGPKRMWCTLNYYNNSLYLYGGYGNNTYSNEMYGYSINNHNWEEINHYYYTPPGTIKHKTVMYKHYIILFGGLFNDINNDTECFNDIYTFNTMTNAWNRVDCINKPQPRCDHGMTIMDDHLIIHGGINQDSRVLSDIYHINLSHVTSPNLNTSEKPIWYPIYGDNPPIWGHVLFKDRSKYVNIRCI